MNRSYFISAWVLVLTAVLYPLQFASTTAAQEPANVLAELQQQYREIETLRADFVQTMRIPQAETPLLATGMLTLQGERYRVETEEQTVVANGETTWIYMHHENQVLIGDYEEDETTFSPTNFFLQFDESYVPQHADEVTRDGQRFVQLVLESNDPSTMFTEITIWIRQEDRMVHRIDVIDVNETEITFELEEVELNPELDEDVFVFDPPEGVEVIDLRT